jgi:hypothetical protein
MTDATTTLTLTVIVTVIDDSERVAVEVHWIGGHHTRTHLVRPVAKLEQAHDSLLLQQRLGELTLRSGLCH